MARKLMQPPVSAQKPGESAFYGEKDKSYTDKTVLQPKGFFHFFNIYSFVCDMRLQFGSLYVKNFPFGSEIRVSAMRIHDDYQESENKTKKLM